MLCVQVLKKNAEAVKKKLLQQDLFAKGYLPLAGRQYVYFPVVKKIHGFVYVDKRCKKLRHIEIDISSYDQVGDIAILGEHAQKSFAKELLKRKNVKVVLQRKGIHEGEFRTQPLRWLAGEKRKETLYKENGVQMTLNVETCYFSPRLGTERMRIARQVKPGEKVLVLFSGVGPYLLVIARHAKPSLIVGVEKNPVAHKYAVENCKKYPNILLYNVDAQDFESPEKFDRVLMPLPTAAEEFLDVAFTHAKKNGVIHFYDFTQETEFPENSLKKIREKIKSFTVLDAVKCGQYAPGKFRVCIDVRV